MASALLNAAKRPHMGSSVRVNGVGCGVVSADLLGELPGLRATWAAIAAVVNPEALKIKISELSDAAAVPNLWDDPESAQKVTSALSLAQSELSRLTNLQKRIDDAETLTEMGLEADDAETLTEAGVELAGIKRELSELEVRTLLNGEYDQREAVVTIRSGAGGVDAADWAEMLFRMYIRWAERQGFPVNVGDISYAEQAGIKSATFEVNAPFAFGNLSVEAGTHRLVRISPFNAQGKRQTSFAAVEVVPLIDDSDEIDIPDTELKVDVFRASGPGGQSVNTTDSAVRMTHIPTGIVVSMQNEKSQLQNRVAALRVLKSRLLLKQREEDALRKKELAGDIKASWGDQMRSYVTHPYQLVKDLRTEHETGNVTAVLDGALDDFIEAGIRWRRTSESDNS